MTEISITRDDADTNGRHVATVDGVEGEGEMTFSKASPTMIIVDHTAGPDGMRGMGLAGALARRVIADACAAGQKTVLLCPFRRSCVERHREDTADVVG